jgi:hypothetical protein
MIIVVINFDYTNFLKSIILSITKYLVNGHLEGSIHTLSGGHCVIYKIMHRGVLVRVVGLKKRVWSDDD